MAGEVTLPEQEVQGAAPVAAPEQAPGFTFRVGGRAPVVNPDGSVGLVDQKDEAAALAQGLRPATLAEFDRADMGTGGKIASGLIGAARGVTLGAFDPLAIEGSRLIGGDREAEDTRQALNRAKNANVNESLGGEIAGSLAGMALMPGGAARGVAAGEGLLARGAARFLAAAPRAAVEGGLMAAGQQASEDALGNHDATAQKYIASIAGGAVFGGLLGGGLHAVGGAVADKAKGFYSKLASGSEALTTSGTRTVAKTGEAVAEKEASPFMSWLRDKVTTGAEENAFKSTGAKIRDIEKLGATAEAQAERTQRIGRKLLDEGIVTGTATQGEIAKRLTTKLAAAGEELSSLRKGLDKALERPSTEAIANRVQAEILAPLERLPGTQTEAGEVRRYMLDFMEKAGDRPSFETLHEFRRALDDKLNPKLFNKVPGTAQPGAVELGKVRGILEDEFTSAGERAAKELGGSFGDKYRLAKEVYSDLKTASKILTKEVARGGANRTWSLTDTIAAASGFAAAGPMGLGAAVLNKGLRTFGNQAAADVLNRASRLEFLQRASSQVNDQIATGVKGFLSGGAGPAASQAPKVTQATVAAIREATRDPSALTEKIAGLLGGQGLNDAAPRTSQAAATTVMRIAAYLRDKAPKDPTPTGVSFVAEKPRTASATEMATFAEAVEAANNPMSVVDDLRRGRVSREKVEALKACYPLLYQQMRSEIASQSAELQPKLSQQQQIGLSVLFDVPVSAIMQPKNIRAFNESFAQGANPEQSGEAGGQQPMQGGRGLNRKGSLASGFDKQEAPP